MRSLLDILPHAQHRKGKLGDVTYVTVTIPVKGRDASYCFDEEDSYEYCRLYCVALQSIFSKCNRVIISTDGFYLYLCSTDGAVYDTPTNIIDSDLVVAVNDPPLAVDLSQGEYVLVLSDECAGESVCTIHTTEHHAISDESNVYTGISEEKAITWHFNVWVIFCSMVCILALYFGATLDVHHALSSNNIIKEDM